MRVTKIILVDDNETFRKAMHTLFAKTGNNQIIAEASNGQEFLYKLKKFNNANIDIVLMDIQMPVMDGIEASKRALLYKPDLKIIALTTFGDSEKVSLMIEAGVCSHIFKYSVYENLENVINLALNNKNFFI